MGVSTDAILAFGFDLGDEGETSLAQQFGADEGSEDGFDFEDWIAAQAGVVYPAGHSGFNSPEYRAYSEARSAAITACPVEVITHCSYEYPMHFLAIRGKKARAYRGSPTEVIIEDVSSELIAAMRSFCEQHNIKWQEPKWHIFSMWG